MINIIEKAKKDYIRKYGVDPSNPKVDIVNGKAIQLKKLKCL
ncbi:hypothetical protein MPF_0500 [Methanohalophilus portucalensis FDF-1]|uniref:Uncharacterized protein n=1 Tax=Methanohalophilus portucalensis FDF-1 TaxID=523843 RepID=A0A1L9C5A8_9EURY|nr:hypothetical protein MPF_0500 [Methanohalophilus portucalensis FDF-1]